MYRVIVAATNAASLEKEYNDIYREMEEIAFERDMESKMGTTPPYRQDVIDHEREIESRFRDLHAQLFKMWENDPTSVSEELADNFEFEASIGDLPFY